MRNKSHFTKVLDEKIIELRGHQVKVSLVMTKTAKGRDLVRTYSNFLKNDAKEKQGEQDD